MKFCRPILYKFPNQKSSVINSISHLKLTPNGLVNLSKKRKFHLSSSRRYPKTIKEKLELWKNKYFTMQLPVFLSAHPLYHLFTHLCTKYLRTTKFRLSHRSMWPNIRFTVPWSCSTAHWSGQLSFSLTDESDYSAVTGACSVQLWPISSLC